MKIIVCLTSNGVQNKAIMLNKNRLLQRHNRKGGLCHNSPRLEHLLKELIAHARWSYGWPYCMSLPGDFGLALLHMMRVDPYDMLAYQSVPLRGARSYIRGDIRHRSFFLRLLELLLLLVVLLIWSLE